MSVAITNNFPQMRNRIERMILAVRSDYHARMTAAFGATLHDLKKRTPKASGGSDVLAFDVGGGQFVFTKRVNHPGTKPYGMIRRARYDLMQRILRINVDVIKLARDVIAGRR